MRDLLDQYNLMVFIVAEVFKQLKALQTNRQLGQAISLATVVFIGAPQCQQAKIRASRFHYCWIKEAEAEAVALKVHPAYLGNSAPPSSQAPLPS